VRGTLGAIPVCPEKKKEGARRKEKTNEELAGQISCT